MDEGTLLHPADNDGAEGAPSLDQQSSILIVDDDAGIRSVIGEYFRAHGFDVTTADSAQEMRERIKQREFDAIVMDVMMPGEDGLAALASLSIDKRPPVVMLSVLGTDIDRIIGIELGADDYLAKPCNPRELLARVRGVIRRHKLTQHADGGTKAVKGDRWSFDGWIIDREGWTLQAANGTIVDLSPHEFRLLSALVRRARRLASRDYLTEEASGLDADSFDRAIDVAISRLRRKLAQHGGEHLIKTVRGEGYMLAVAAQQVG